MKHISRHVPPLQSNLVTANISWARASLGASHSLPHKQAPGGTEGNREGRWARAGQNVKSKSPENPSTREKKRKWKSSVVSDSLRPHGLHSPWNSPGQNTGVRSLSLLQGIVPTQGSNPGLLHCRQILYQLSHKGSPKEMEEHCYSFTSHWSSPAHLKWIWRSMADGHYPRGQQSLWHVLSQDDGIAGAFRNIGKPDSVNVISTILSSRKQGFPCESNNAST